MRICKKTENPPVKASDYSDKIEAVNSLIRKLQNKPKPEVKKAEEKKEEAKKEDKKTNGKKANGKEDDKKEAKKEEKPAEKMQDSIPAPAEKPPLDSKPEKMQP